MNITILCKVVDNFGDIGVVYRLVKQIKKIRPKINLHLVCDNLSSFNKICDSVQDGKEFQNVQEINIYDWNAYDLCYKTFSENDGENLSIILECFQCGRPDWMEKILFEDKLNRTVNIIMIDYLTAEQYAEDFHCLKSLTRSSKVQKVNFMPGFTQKTGGLVLDSEWKSLTERNANGPVLVFTYERDWSGLANAIFEWNKTATRESTTDENAYSTNATTTHQARQVLVAQGRGQKSFLDACKNIPCKKIPYIRQLDFMNQTEWDKMMKSCSILFIRGEESLSRACLSGIPFVWQAYPQSSEYQIVKVNALLERMKRHFKADDFEVVQKAWISINFNTTMTDTNVLNTTMTDTSVLKNDLNTTMTDTSMLKNNLKIQQNLENFLFKVDDLEYGFRDFALDLRKNGDQAANLMTFIEKNIII